MKICAEAKALLFSGGWMAVVLLTFSKALPNIAENVTEAIRYARICRSAEDVSVGIFIVCLIGAIAFDLGKRMK